MYDIVLRSIYLSGIPSQREQSHFLLSEFYEDIRELWATKRKQHLPDGSLFLMQSQVNSPLEYCRK